MTYEPMLSMPLNPNKLDQYVMSDQFWFEQKLDGIRLGVIVDTHLNPTKTAEAWNRQGNMVPVSGTLLEIFNRMRGSGLWVFDGEYINGVFWVFDLPEAGGKIDYDTPYNKRRAGLEAIFPLLVSGYEDPPVKLLPTHRTVAEKAELVKWCREHNAEGVMVKRYDSIYWPGRRSPDCLKSKFVETIDAIVTVVGRDGKNSISLTVYDDATGELLKDGIGHCTVQPKMLDILKVGDVIEAKYLYGTKKNRIYQASFLRVRHDKAPEECFLSQMKYGDKGVKSG